MCLRGLRVMRVLYLCVMWGLCACYGYYVCLCYNCVSCAICAGVLRVSCVCYGCYAYCYRCYVHVIGGPCVLWVLCLCYGRYKCVLPVCAEGIMCVSKASDSTTIDFARLKNTIASTQEYRGTTPTPTRGRTPARAAQETKMLTLPRFA